MTKIILGVTVAVLASAGAVLAAQQTALQKHMAEDSAQLAAMPRDVNIPAMQAECDAMTRVINGALALEGYFYRSASDAKDKRIYYAEKVAGLEKRMRKKAEEQGIKYPNVFLPKNLPSEKDADMFVRQLESAEAIVDAGLTEGVRFKDVRVSVEHEESGDGTLLTEVAFETSGDSLAAFLYGVVGRKPLLPVTVFSFERAPGGLKGLLRVEEVPASEAVLRDFVPDEKNAKDLSSRMTVDGQRKKTFFAAAFMKTKEPAPTAVVAVKREEKPTFVFKGLAKKKGVPCAVIEDSAKDELYFLLAGEKAGMMTVMSFEESTAVIRDTTTGKEETLKREID